MIGADQGVEDRVTVRIGVVGTSWWVDSMYLPALAAHPGAEVVGICGRDTERTRARAEQWDIGWWSVDNDEFVDPQRLDAVVVAATDDTHEPLTVLAIERGLHVLCEKPVAATAAGARRMATAAAAAERITLVPFTYRYMPTFRHVKRLVDEGFVGRPYQLGMRYFTGYARDGAYSWRFDADGAGSGVVGDLGPHWLHVARWLLGEVTHIGATTARLVERDARPDGSEYTRADDLAQMTVRFESGAVGSLIVSAVCHEGTEFDQTHHLDLHGAEGTIYSLNDWSSTQTVHGVRAGEPGPAAPLPMPDDIWGASRRDRVHDTYRDVFRVEGHMIGDWVDAVAAGVPCEPNLAEGARVQLLVEAAQASAADGGRLVEVPADAR